MNDFEILQVGGKYPPLAGAKECVAITIGDNGITIVYNFNRPTEKEIAGMQANQPFEIRYVVLNDVLYILTKCGSNNWTDAPYTPHLPSPGELSRPTDETKGYALTLMMVDAVTNTIKSLRTIGLGHQFSCDLYDTIQELKKKPFDKGLYFTAVAMNNHVYSTNDLVKFTSQRWKLRG